MPILNDPTARAALLVGGVGAAVCASVVATYSWLNKEKSRKRKKNLRKNSKNPAKTEILTPKDEDFGQNEETLPVSNELLINASESSSIDCSSKGGPIDISLIDIDSIDVDDENMQTMATSTRGGRINYRAMKKRQLNASSSVDSQNGSIDQGPIDHPRHSSIDNRIDQRRIDQQQWPSSPKDIAAGVILENGHHPNSTQAIPSSSSFNAYSYSSNNNCQQSQLTNCQQGQLTCQYKQGGQQQQQQQTEAEVRATQLAAEFSRKISLNSSSSDVNASSVNLFDVNSSNVNTIDNCDTSNAIVVGYSASDPNNGSVLNHSGDSLSTVIMKEHHHHSSAESPSLNIDGRSEGSQDSGKGASVGVTSSVSPVEELLSGVEQPYVYEFEIPQNIVGLIIGRQGVTIKQITEKSGAQMIIRKHYTGDNHKICTIEGRREQINDCLRIIRRKFPPSRFPELKLTPLLPPPIISPVTPVLDSIVRLSLPEGVKCEIVVSSLIEPDHFFVQQPTHPSFTSLARLDQYMLAVYNQVMGVPGLPRPIEEGVICAAPVMDGWFRAQTIEMCEEAEECLVKFVDYGGYLKIPSNDLRQIRSDFMTLPFQAIECTLHNVKPFNEDEGWSPESMAYFEQCIYGKIVEAYVKGVNPNCTMAVDLYYNVVDSYGQEQTVTINQTLVENGFAKWIIDDVTSNNSNNANNSNM